MASWEPLRNEIIRLLGTISTIQEVQEFPSEEFNGYPVAMLETVRNESIFETTTQNKRTYIFNVYVLQAIDQVDGDDKMKQARRIVQGVVDDVLNTFDQNQTLTSAVMPAKEIVIISMPSLSSIFTSSDTKYIVGEIELKIITSFDVS